MSAGDWKAMFEAAQDGALEVVRYYLAQGVDPNHQHPEVMSTPLFISIKHGHRDVVELLLAQGADPGIKTQLEGMDARQAARHYKRDDILRILDKHHTK